MPDRSDPRETQQFRQRMHRLESLVEEVERFKDLSAREQTRQIIQSLLELHSTGLDRLLEHVAATGEQGLALIDSMAKDEMVCSLLLLHGLHPAGFESRVRQALDQVRPYLHSHGGDVELLGVEDNVVRLRMQGSCHGCPSSAMTLKTAIEEAIYEKAPDVKSIEVEGVVQQPAAPAAFVPVEQLFNHERAKAAVAH
jgi:Fe-S cluster biogenesis protein NfuA